MDFNADDIKRMLYGGDKSATSTPSDDNVNIAPQASIQIYHPHITRDIISVFEYANVVTKLAKHLQSLPSLEQYIPNVDTNQIIDPTELAFNLLEEGKWDAIIDRGYEKVTYSTLRVRQQWKDMLRNYFDQRRVTIENELLRPLKLLDGK